MIFTDGVPEGYVLDGHALRRAHEVPNRITCAACAVTKGRDDFAPAERNREAGRRCAACVRANVAAPPQPADMRGAPTCADTSGDDDAMPCLFCRGNAYNDRTALHAAGKAGHGNCVRALARRGMTPQDINRKNGNGETALHLACIDVKADDAVRALLEVGADPRAAANDGGTPLHTATFRLAFLAIRHLLAAGADPNAKDARGGTPMDDLASAVAQFPGAPPPGIAEALRRFRDVAKRWRPGRGPAEWRADAQYFLPERGGSGDAKHADPAPAAAAAADSTAAAAAVAAAAPAATIATATPATGPTTIIIEEDFDYFSEALAPPCRDELGMRVVRREREPGQLGRGLDNATVAAIAVNTVAQVTAAEWRAVAAFVHGGGVAIHYNEPNHDAMNAAFPGLQWRMVEYVRTSSSLTEAGKRLLPQLHATHRTVSAKCVYMDDVPEEEALYTTSPESVPQGLSAVCHPGRTLGVGRMCAAAMHRHGAGVLLHIPDVNTERGFIAAAVEALRVSAPGATAGAARIRATRDTAVRAEAEAEAHAKDGAAKLQAGDFAGAVAAFDAAIAAGHRPREPALLTNRALANIKLAQAAEATTPVDAAAKERHLALAMADCRRALRLDPQWQRGVQRLAHAHALGGNYIEALALLDRLRDVVLASAVEELRQLCHAGMARDASK